MGKNDVVAEEIIKINSLPKNEDAFTEMYKRQTVKNLLRLDDVQAEVIKLIKAGKIEAGLEGVFKGITDTIKDLNAAMGRKFTEYDQKNEGYDKKFNEQTEQALNLLRERKSIAASAKHFNIS